MHRIEVTFMVLRIRFQVTFLGNFLEWKSQMTFGQSHRNGTRRPVGWVRIELISSAY